MAGRGQSRGVHTIPGLPAFPYERDRLTERERIERLAGWNLDRCEDIMCLPLETVLAHRQAPLLLNAQIQVSRALFNLVAKVGLENSRLAMEREKILAEMTRREFGDKK